EMVFRGREDGAGYPGYPTRDLCQQLVPLRSSADVPSRKQIETFPFRPGEKFVACRRSTFRPANLVSHRPETTADRPASLPQRRRLAKLSHSATANRNIQPPGRRSVVR